MIDPKQFADRVSALEARLEEKLSLRGKSLQRRVAKAGRRLPKRLRAEAQLLVDAQAKLSHPKLAVQVDEARVNKAFQELEAHLKTIDPKDRRRGKLLNWMGGLVLNLLVLLALFLLLLRWQGFI